MKNINFNPQVWENEKVKAVNFLGLCKSCELCVEVCPAKAISRHPKNLGVYGSPAISIDIQKCIACQTCERLCPDSAIKIEKLASS